MKNMGLFSRKLVETENMAAVEQRVSQAELPSTEHFRAPRSRPEALESPKNLGELVQGLRYIFEDDNIDVENIKKYIASYKSVREDWIHNAKFDKHRYTRHLIDEGNGKYNLILLCWDEGQQSCIHDHSNSHCFMKMLNGSLVETLYSWPIKTEPMVPSRRTIAKENEVVYINDDIGLHRVGNESTTKAVSLHLYSPPYKMCQSFDEKSGKKVKCNVTFHSKHGEKVTYGTPN